MSIASEARVDSVVIGAGVVGLAIARELSLRGREVVVLEAADRIGTGASARNSEVIHAGLYYLPGSLKARLCVEGRRALYAYCEARGIPHRRIGKLIVATEPGQWARLEAIEARARANGVEDLQRLGPSEVHALEPALGSAAGALLSPSTGIIDAHALMDALAADASHGGAVIVKHAPVLRGQLAPDGITLEVGGGEPSRVRARSVINAAGYGAQSMATRLEGLPPSLVPPLFLAKGNYFALRGKAPFGRLIYPLPEPGGLGVHLTLDLGGGARFGPDVQWVEEPDFTVDESRAPTFYAAIRRYWPALPDGALQPAFAGVRSRVVGRDASVEADFVIQLPQNHGVRGLVNLFGIESPGLTSALAIASYVADGLA